jgi:DNA-binding transcriptional regulator YdaS (Cro superfamily)
MHHVDGGLRQAIEAAGGALRRDEGLRLAIRAAGGIRPLARALGINPASLMKWMRVPTDRILQVEAVTSIPREKLRPDLYRSNNNLASEDRS